MHLSVAGPFHRSSPAVDLLDGQWHDLAFTANADHFTFYIDGQKAHEIELGADEVDALFAQEGYGLAIGSSGPWTSSRSTAFNVDDLSVSSKMASNHEIAQSVIQRGLIA